ncbi:hypothetical protein A3C89_00325 [Candidatus Kaiserbacteria bacterium RIFCSPHIGHO2_02_FULL_50_50]|uniref:Primosomal protein N' 3' DNA-binding domain-containing protein n=1 Tax=Candidatus Kaiserbacteria bacterium RIFCSPHIGHO2_02_FULL_50_50 TaxID=1798492 RepID=A0A1F6DDZ7_9BACT|nr:MAG: hypothetical protein A3C89_00325 [Candidatus Kaiserbacteria bacterium RIFCSPHIGHO2_02_FULL_50_50]OGG89190.1 MAG: hypothetical protein A3G62_01005 [Candidatus Kaiserbacteria bacterium RIFCSPLOWO2_12_FULL_50_10]
MFIIRTLPLQKGGHIDELTYFSRIPYELGTFLTVPVRNRTLTAMVVAAEPVPSVKSVLRSMTFSLKKLPEQPNAQALTPASIATAVAIAHHYAITVGEALFALLPAGIRDGDRPLPFTPKGAVVQPDGTATLPETDIRVLQGAHIERTRIYRTLVRESFARGGSVLIVAPTSIEVTELAKTLAHGIEDRTIVIHANLTPKQLRAVDAGLQEFATPKLIITYPGYALIERHDIVMTIIEHERSPHYVQRTYPHIDVRTAVRMHAERTGRTLIYGDLFPRVETEHLRRSGTYETLDETPKRLALPGKLVPIAKPHRSSHAEPFELFGKRVLDALEKTLAEGGRVFLYAARRGLAPVVTCVDCGYVFRSPQSGAPYSLVRTTTKSGEAVRLFVDAVSGVRLPAADHCTHCGSWRIRERGIGIQHVYDELVKRVEHPVILFDHTTATTAKRARYLGDRFRQNPGTLMLGTAMALPYIGDDVTLSVIVNTDALRATPTWRAQEDMLATILTLRERTHGTVYAQTQHARVDTVASAEKKDVEPDDILDIARLGATERFYTEEITARDTFGYPPFTRFVLLTYRGTPEDIAAHESVIKERLGGKKPFFYNGQTDGTLTIRHALLRLNPNDTDPALPHILGSLGDAIQVTHDPERII